MRGLDGSPGSRFDDARWFPVDLDVRRGLVHMLDVDEIAMESAAFIDTRLQIDWAAARQVSINEISNLPMPMISAAWLWHTSFCGSTLLARMLHLTPYAFSLREPLVLRRLSDARATGIDIGSYLRPIIAALGRPWHDGGRVVIKPTHAALNIGCELITQDRNSRAVILCSSLEDFIVSHLKKTPQTLRSIPILTDRALNAAVDFRGRLGGDALNPPDLLCHSALQWAVQRELVAELMSVGGGDRIRVIDFDLLLRRPVDAAIAASEWLGLHIPRKDLSMHAQRLSHEHAKVPTRPYDGQARQDETTMLWQAYRSDIERVLAWARRSVLPAMRAEAIVASNQFQLHLDTNTAGTVA